VVDDDGDTREMLEAYLTYVGATVRTASKAIQALELFKAAPPSLVVTDIRMPGEDGLWLLEHLRSLPGASRVPIVALTGRVGEQHHGVIRAAGFDAYVVKPLDLDEFVELIAMFGRR
jgi:CheY-like chemotaxis protein